MSVGARLIGPTLSCKIRRALRIPSVAELLNLLVQNKICQITKEHLQGTVRQLR